MAIKSTLQVQFPGLKNPLPIQGGFTRIVKFEGETSQLGLTAQQTPNPTVKLHCLEWESKEGAQRIYEPTQPVPFEGDPEKYDGVGYLVSETNQRHADVDFDQNDPEHTRQLQAAEEAYRNSQKDREVSEEELANHFKGWKPSVLEEYTVYSEVFDVWNGKYAEEPLRTRILELPLAQAIQVVQMQVPGTNPQENCDRIESQVYRAAMLSGLFVDAEYA